MLNLCRLTTSSHAVCCCSGIGIVNAIEVVNAFPEEDGLRKFRQWVESPDPTIFGKFDTKSGSSVRKRGSKREENVIGTKSNIQETIVEQNTSPTHEQEESSDYVQEMKMIFMDKHVILFPAFCFL